jgi:hypothetical protein
VNDSLPVNVLDVARDADGELEETADAHGGPEQTLQRATTEVRQDERGHAFVALEGDRSNRASWVEVLGELVLAPEALHVLRSRPPGSERFQQDGHVVELAERAVHDGRVSFVNLLDNRVLGSAHPRHPRPIHYSHKAAQMPCFPDLQPG